MKLTAEQKKAFGPEIVKQIEQRLEDATSRGQVLTEIDEFVESDRLKEALAASASVLVDFSKLIKTLHDLGGSRNDVEVVQAYAAAKSIELGGRGRGVSLDKALEWHAVGRPGFDAPTVSKPKSDDAE